MLLRQIASFIHNTPTDGAVFLQHSDEDLFFLETKQLSPRLRRKSKYYCILLLTRRISTRVLNMNSMLQEKQTLVNGCVDPANILSFFQLI